MITKLKRQPAKRQYERYEGDFRLVSVEEINSLIDEINLQTPKQALITVLEVTGEPQLTVLNNTLSKSIQLEYVSSGVYKLIFTDRTADTLIVPNDIVIAINGNDQYIYTVRVQKVNEQEVSLRVFDNTGQPIDNLLSGGDGDKPLFLEFKTYV